MNEHLTKIQQDLSADESGVYESMLDAIDTLTESDVASLLMSWRGESIQVWSAVSELLGHETDWLSDHPLTPGNLLYCYVVVKTAEHNPDVTDLTEFKWRFYDMTDELIAAQPRWESKLK
jgi:hypothetical protein